MVKNPNTAKYFSLPEAFDAFGSSVHPDSWTGDEKKARDIPPPEEAEDVMQMLGEYQDTPLRTLKWRDLQNLKSKPNRPFARKVPPHEQADRYRPSDEEEPDVAPQRDSGLRVPPDWKTWNSPDSDEYRAEFEARKKRDEAEIEFRDFMHETAIGAILYEDKSGKTWVLEHQAWWANSFVLNLGGFRPGWGEFENQTGWILIDRNAFTSELKRNRGPKSTIGAEAKLRRWLNIIIEKGAKSKPKRQYWEEASKEFGQSLSKRSFDRIWDQVVPDDWKKAGKPRSKKSSH